MGSYPDIVNNATNLILRQAISTNRKSVPDADHLASLGCIPATSPDRALVLCVDEKSQIQALDRTRPLLPLRPGQVERCAPMITCATAPRPSSPLWTPRPATTTVDTTLSPDDI